MTRAAIVFAFLILSGVVCSDHAAAKDGESIALFNGESLEGWFGPDGDASANWKASEGNLICTGEPGTSWIATKQEFADFELTLEFNLPKNGNSGVFIRAPKEGAPYVDGMEIQLLDDGGDKWNDLKPDQFTGAIYAVVPPSQRATKAAGEWQTMRIVCVGRTCKAWVNGKPIIYANLDKLVESHGKKVPGLKRDAGHIGLQNHGDPVRFRNLRIRKL